MRIKGIIPSKMPLPVGAVIPAHYNIAVGEMYDSFGIVLPRYEDVGFHNDYTLRLSREPFEIKVWWENDYLWWWKFGRCFWTDFASIPRILRVAIDNDDNRVIIPAILHDDLFQGKILDQIYGEGLGFSQANTLLREALRWYGVKEFMCNRMYDAVNTSIGKKSYAETIPREAERRVKFAILSPEQQQKYNGDESIFN